MLHVLLKNLSAAAVKNDTTHGGVQEPVNIQKITFLVITAIKVLLSTL